MLGAWDVGLEARQKNGDGRNGKTSGRWCVVAKAVGIGVGVGLLTDRRPATLLVADDSLAARSVFIFLTRLPMAALTGVPTFEVAQDCFFRGILAKQSEWGPRGRDIPMQAPSVLIEVALNSYS